MLSIPIVVAAAEPSAIILRTASAFFSGVAVLCFGPASSLVTVVVMSAVVMSFVAGLVGLAEVGAGST